MPLVRPQSETSPQQGRTTWYGREASCLEPARFRDPGQISAQLIVSGVLESAARFSTVGMYGYVQAYLISCKNNGLSISSKKLENFKGRGASRGKEIGVSLSPCRCSMRRRLNGSLFTPFSCYCTVYLGAVPLHYMYRQYLYLYMYNTYFSPGGKA